jgi:hypothetical protein
VEGKFDWGGEVADEGQVGVGFGGAKAVVEVCDVKGEAKLGAAGVQGAKERDGISAAGDRDGEAQAGAEERGIKREMRRAYGHQRMIAPERVGDEGLRSRC